MHWLRLIALFGAGAAALASPVPPSCVAGTLADYLALSDGCDIVPHTLTFTNFSFTASVLEGTPTVLTAGEIEVTPGLVADGGLQLSFSSSGFHVDSGQEIQYILSYTIDPPPPEILHFRSSMVPDPPPPPGTASVSTELCLHGAFSGAICPSGQTLGIGVYITGPVQRLDATTSLFPPDCCNILGVRDIITIAGSPSEPAGFDSFANAPLTDLPEPANGLLTVCGLLCFVLLIRRVHTKFS